MSESYEPKETNQTPPPHDRKSLLLTGLLLLALVVGLFGIFSQPQKETESKPEKSAISYITQRNKPGIALVEIQGPIQMKGQYSSMIQQPNSAEQIVKSLQQISRMDNIKAVVLRINSPGGTVAATQEIYNAVMRLRKKGIVTVASMGDIAASGGYYVASACETIFANRGTMTGSIGVIISAPNLKELFDRVGIDFHTFKAGKYKDILSMNRDMTRQEIQHMQKLVDSTYQQFVKDVAQGRNMPHDTIARLAQGKIYNGKQAQENRLIDKTGDLYHALHFAHKKADLPGDQPNVIPLKGQPWERFLGQLRQRGSFWHNLLRSLYLLGQGPPALQAGQSSPKPQTWYQKAQETNHDYLIQYLYRP